MIQESTLHFLTDLQENNHKEWFDANRKRYDAAKKNFLAVTTELLEGLAKQDEAIAQADLDPKKTLTRINRDIRFSKDKTPYNAHFFTTLSAGGKKSPMAGYYLRVSPDESFHGGGVYMPDNAVLGKIRQEIDYHVEEWKAIVEGPELTTHYGALQTNGALSRPPKGYPADHPALDWLKRKGHYSYKPISAAELLQEDWLEKVLAHFRAIQPLIAFINRALV